MKKSLALFRRPAPCPRDPEDLFSNTRAAGRRKDVDQETNTACRLHTLFESLIFLCFIAQRYKKTNHLAAHPTIARCSACTSAGDAKN